MYDICHPSYYYIGRLGCNTPIKISTTFYVYLELCESKCFWNVNYKYNKKLDLLYLEATKKKNSALEIFIPWPVPCPITLQQIEEIQKELQLQRFTIVFKSEDSSSVSYIVSAGLTKPTPPEVSKFLKEKEEKKLALEKDIRKNTSNLYELAQTLTIENETGSCSVNQIKQDETANIVDDIEKTK